MPHLANSKYCTGCLSCKDACPQRAIETVMKNGLTFVHVNSSLCIECMVCEKACPIVSPIKKNLVSNMRVYRGWAKDPYIRHLGASGGGFTALARCYIFSHLGNVAVYGVVMVDNNVYHERVTTLNELSALMNSKYIQSDTDGIYRKVKKDLVENVWVMFSGTPCQIAALYGFLGKMRNDKHLITVEIICHGIPGKEAIDLHLQYFHSSHIYSFRNKDKGWSSSQCTTIDINDQKYCCKRKEDVFFKIFSTWLLDRTSCSNCQYSSLNRVADITLGDFWGEDKNDKDNEEGVSVIVANNERANNFIINADEVIIKPSSIRKAISGNPNFYTGYKYIQYHPLVLFPVFFRKHLSPNLRFNILTRRIPWNYLWAVYKILTTIHNKIAYRNILKKYAPYLDMIYENQFRE